MIEVWIFSYCLMITAADGSVECNYEKEFWPSYEACTQRQNEYVRDNFGKSFVTFCTREDEIRV